MRVSLLIRSLSRILIPLTWGSTAIGAVALGIMMAVTVTDITLRATLRMGVLGNIDLVVLTLILVFFSGYTSVELKKKHVQVDVLVGMLPAAVQRIITTTGYLLTLGVIILVTWQCFEQAMFLKSGHIVTGLLHIPLWPLLVVTTFFFVLFMLALLINLLTQLVELPSAKSYLWLLPGLIIVLGFFMFSLWPNLLPLEITRGTWGLIVTALLFVLIFLKVHIGAAFALTALLGMSYLSGAQAALSNLSLSAVRVASTYTWSVMPLFIWMGLLSLYGGFAKELYTAAYKWIGRVAGGLASATVTACAGLAAVTGSSLTGVLAMGVISLPEMRERKYDMRFASATICVASTIGNLIPPSIAFVLYGMITEVSIGKLFIAGIFPGILFTIMLITMITVRCRLNPKLGPPGPATPWKEKAVSLKGVWAVMLLMMLVIGGLYGGIFTPTEAGAVGAFGALAISVVRRRLNFKGITNSMLAAVEMTGIIYFIFVFATAFSYFLALTNLPKDLSMWITGLGLSRYAIIALILFIYMILGCLMNVVPAVILTLPIFFPIVMACGFDPVWFGVLVTIMCELGVVTPPIGMNVFAMAAIAEDVPMYSIFKGILPYWGFFIILIIILVIFPQISLFLPSLMK